MKSHEKTILLKLTAGEHQMIKLKAVQRKVTITQLIVMAIKKINGGEDGKV